MLERIKESYLTKMVEQMKGIKEKNDHVLNLAEEVKSLMNKRKREKSNFQIEVKSV